ncbi:hypothetical protein R3P38DRAFT_2578653 [Favolaschia claudopus]|uniref:Uncharacterized protein n=1 Tax=Favolaschia claudopus TaxID=2862362 RepID=A0AAV9ZGJ2_9AGAR
MVAWTDFSHRKNPACKFAGSCRKFYPATLVSATVEALGLDCLCGCVGIQHFDSDSSAQVSFLSTPIFNCLTLEALHR